MTVEYFLHKADQLWLIFCSASLQLETLPGEKKIPPLMWTEIALRLMKWSHRNSVAEILFTIFFSFIEIINYYLYHPTFLLFLWCFNELTKNLVLISKPSRRRPWAREQHFFLVDSWVSFPYLTWSICRCARNFTRFGNVYWVTSFWGFISAVFCRVE